MNDILLVVTHYLGPDIIRIGDMMLHTPLFGWLQHVTGKPIAVGSFQEFEWILKRCPAVRSFECIRSPEEAWAAARGRLLLLNDLSIDEYGYHQDGLTYTQIIARRLGIPIDAPELQVLLYQTTTPDRKSAKALLHQLGYQGQTLITVNVRSRTRVKKPGMYIREYLQFCQKLAEMTGAMVLIGDVSMTSCLDGVYAVSVSLPVWAALIEQSELWLGECTGPYHLACALRTPTAMFSALGMDDDVWAARSFNEMEHKIYQGLSENQAGQEVALRELADIVR
jgi:hypothetical protein